MAFGAQIKLSVNQSASAQNSFRREIQAMVDAATAKSPIKIKNVQLDLSDGEKRKLINQVQQSFVDGALTLKIKQIDASAAVKKLHGDLEKMLSSLKISGLREYMEGNKSNLSAQGAAGVIAEQGRAAAAATKQLSDYNAAIKELVHVEKQLEKARGFAGTSVTDEGRIDEIISKYRELHGLIELIRADKGAYVAGDIEYIEEQTRALYENAEAWKKAEEAEHRKNDVSTRLKELSKVDKGAADNIDAIQKRLKALYSDTMGLEGGADLRRQIADAQRDLAAAIDLTGDAQRDAITASADLASRIQKQTDELLENEKAAKKNAKSKEDVAKEDAKAAKAAADYARQIESMKARVRSFMENNPRGARIYGDSLNAILSELSQGTDLPKERFAEMQKTFTQVSSSLEEAGLAGKGFFDRLREGYEKFGGWSIVTKSLTSAYQAITKMVTAVKSLDAAMTELKKVTDLTSSAYDSFLKKAGNTAKSIGATVSDTVNATADFARLGFNLEDASMLAESALTYKNIGDGIEDVSEASESLISTIKAFGLEAEDATHIVNSFNEVGNNFAITSSGIGDALQRSASALAAAGNTMEESIGMITAMNSVIQNPESVGTAIKTLTMYLRAAKTEAEEAGIATDGMAGSVSELRAELLSLTGGKLDIMIDEENFKSTFQIMKELSLLWDDLSDISKSNILNQIAGKRNANAVTALITNFEDAEKAAVAAAESTGSAFNENQKYLDSIAGKISQMQAQFEVMSNSVLDSELFKFFVDLANSILSVVTALSELKLLWPAIAGTVVLFKGLSNITNLNETTKKLDEMIKNGKEWSDIATSLAPSITKLTSAQKKQLITTLMSSDAFKSLTDEEKKDVLVKLGLAKATDSATASNMGFAASLKAIWIATPMWMKVATAIVSAISVIAFGSKLVRDYRQNLVDTANEIKDAFTEADESYQNNINSLNGLKERFYELSKGIGAQGENVSLTADEYEEYYSIVDQIASISPKIVQGYNDEGHAILNYTTAINDAIKSQEEYIENQRSIYVGSGQDVFKGSRTEFKEAQKNLESGLFDFMDTAGGGLYQSQALRDALNKVGVDVESYVDSAGMVIFTGFTEGAEKASEQIYNARGTIVSALSQSGWFDDSMVEVEAAIASLGGLSDSLQNVRDEWADWVYTYFNFTEDEKFKDTLKNIPIELSGYLTEGIAESADFSKSWSDNVESAKEFADELAGVYLQNSERIDELKRQATDVDTRAELTTYNKAITDFVDGLETSGVDTVVANIIESWLMGQTVSANIVDDINTNVQTTLTGLNGLSEALKALASGNDVKITALGEMANGGLTQDTIESITAALPEGAHISDFVNMVGEGADRQFELNIEKWDKLTQDLVQQDIQNIESHIDGLEKTKASLLEALKYSDHEGDDYNALLANISEVDDAIEQYTADLDIYYAAIGQAAEDSVRSIDGTIAAAKTARSEAKGLFDALDKIRDGEALGADERVSLIEATPALAETGFINAETADEQKAILDALTSEMENAYDDMLQSRIDLLENEKTAADASAQAEIAARQEVLRALQGEGLQLDVPEEPFGFDQAADSANAGAKAIDLYTQACKELDTAGKVSTDTLQALHDLAGSDEAFAGLFGADGELVPENILDLSKTGLLTAMSELDKQYVEMVNSGDASTESVNANRIAYEMLRDVLQQVGEAADGVADLTVAEAVSQAADIANSIDSVMEKAKSDMEEYGHLTGETLGEMADTFGKDFERTVQLGADGNYRVLEGAVRAVKEEQIAATGVSESYSNAIAGNGEDAHTAADKIERMHEVLDDRMGDINLYEEAFGEIGENGYNELDTLLKLMESFPGIADRMINWDADGGPIVDIQALRAEIEKTIMESEEIANPAIKQAMIAQLNLVGKEATAYGKLTAAIEKTDAALGSLVQAREEMATGSLTSGTITDIAEQLSPTEHLSDYIYVQEGQIRLNEEAWHARTVAIEEARLAELEAIDTTEMSDQALDAHRVQLEIQRAKLQEVKSALHEMSAEMVASYEGTAAAAERLGAVQFGDQLSYDEYRELIDIDSRYAQAVEYQNGVMTLNTEKHAEITESILQETLAMAEAEAAAIMMSDEYKNLISMVGDLNPEQQQRLDDLNAEIMAYSVLSNELENATDAFERFKRASKDPNTDKYTQMVEAFSVVNDVLYNKKSDIYQMKGLSAYKEAIELLSDFEVGTDGWDEAIEQVERYSKEAGEGVRNFVNDLTEHGFRDPVTGAINGTISEISSALGVAEHVVRAMIDQMNQYVSGNPIQVETSVPDADKNLIDIAKELLGIEESADDAATEIENMGDSTETPQEKIVNLSNLVDELGTKIDLVSAKEVDIKTNSAVGRIGAVSSAVSNLINKLRQLSQNSSVNIKITQSMSGSRVPTSSSSSSSSSSGGWLSGLLGSIGLANAGGTNNSPGGRTLVGELGMETVVDPNTNRWYTVGNHGAEFVNLPAGAIVFNARQTEELFGRGSTGGRGQALAVGNAAYAAGNAMASGNGLLGSLIDIGKKIYDSGKKVVSSLFGSSSSKSSKKDSDNVSGSFSNDSLSDLKPSGSSNKGGGSGSSSAKEEASELEKLKEKYEEVNKQAEHLIQHQEFLYDVAERGYNYKGMQTSLEEQIKIYKQIMANCEEAIAAMQAAGADDTSEELQAMEETYWSAYRSMYETLDEINVLHVEALGSKIDDLQSAYTNLQKAADELGENGGISVDTFQALISNGLQYMSVLDIVGDQYVINREAIAKLMAAEKEQLAIESALSYVTQLRTALNNKDANAVAKLVNVNQVVSETTWGMVFAQAALLRNLGLTDEQYRIVIRNLGAFKNISDEVISDITSGVDNIGKSASDLMKDQSDALEDILEYTKDLIEYETEEQIDAINDQIDAYRDIIDLKKESLRVTKEENNYNRDVSDKTKEISDLQARIDLLSLDDSNAARAERAALIEELNEKQRELADFQADHAYEAQVDALDKMGDEYEESRQDEIKALEDSISSAEKLYQLAIKRINDEWNTLYKDLIDWNTKAGNSLNSEITSAWEAAAAAVKKYGSYVAAIDGIKVDTEKLESGKNNVVANGVDNITNDSATNSPFVPPVNNPPENNDDDVEQPVSTVVITGGKWNVREEASKNSDDLGTVRTGEEFEYGGETVGTWNSIIYKGKKAWVSTKGSKVVQGFSGGGYIADLQKIAIGNGDDIITVNTLKKGEAVLTPEQSTQFRQLTQELTTARDAVREAKNSPPLSGETFISTMREMQDRLISVLDRWGANSSKVGTMLGKLNTVQQVVTNNDSLIFNPEISVEINHSGDMLDENAVNFGESIADAAISKLREALSSRGIFSSYSTGLS